MDFEYVDYAFKVLYVPEYLLFEILALIVVAIVRKRIKAGRVVRLTLVYPFIYLGYVIYDVFTYFNAKNYGVSTYVDASVMDIVSSATDYVVFTFIMFLVFVKLYEIFGLIKIKDAQTDMLKKYKEMRKEKLINEEEYKKLKKEALGMGEKDGIEIVDI